MTFCNSYSDLLTKFRKIIFGFTPIVFFSLPKESRKIYFYDLLARFSCSIIIIFLIISFGNALDRNGFIIIIIINI